MVRVPGALLYVGADFASVGGLSGLQAVKILKRHTRPDVLPILKQDRPTILVDPERVLALNVTLPAHALEHRGRHDKIELPADDQCWRHDRGQ